MASNEPLVSLKSGALEEGAHRLKFRTAGAKPRFAPPTRVEIIFNNAAPKASIRTPADGSFGAGENVTVSGVAAKDWDVSVNGKALDTDRQRRFSGEVSYSGEHKAVVIRLRHPKKGIHYYLRRSKQYGR